MKYIKLFENNNAYYWQIPTKMPDLIFALRKIGMENPDDFDS